VLAAESGGTSRAASDPLAVVGAVRFLGLEATATPFSAVNAAAESVGEAAVADILCPPSFAHTTTQNSSDAIALSIFLPAHKKSLHSSTETHHLYTSSILPTCSPHHNPRLLFRTHTSPTTPSKFSQSATSPSSSPLWTECNLTANLSENSPYQKKKKKTPTTICREEIDPETEAQTIAAIKERWRQNQNEKMKNA
jgi:hypothetical protein